MAGIFDSFPELETRRLLLKQIKEHHAPDLFKIFSDPEAMRYYDLTPVKEIGEVKKIINSLQQRYERQEAIRWGIFLSEEDEMIGTCGFVHWNNHSRRGEIGYELNRKYWRRGIMSEALRGVLSFGFKRLQLNRIQASVEPGNLASQGILRKLGFKEEGLLREYFYYKDNFRDALMFSLLQRETGQE